MKHFRRKLFIAVYVCLFVITMIGCSSSSTDIEEKNNDIENDARVDKQEMSPYMAAYSELCAGYDAINEYKEATDKLRESVGDEIAHSLVCCCLDFEDAGHYVTGTYFDDSAFDFYNTNYSILKSRYESLAQNAQKADIKNNGIILREYYYINGSRNLNVAFEFTNATCDENEKILTAEEIAQNRSMTAYVNGKQVEAEYEVVYAPKSLKRFGYYVIDWTDLEEADNYVIEMDVENTIFKMEMDG